MIAGPRVIPAKSSTISALDPAPRRQLGTRRRRDVLDVTVARRDPGTGREIDERHPHGGGTAAAGRSARAPGEEVELKRSPRNLVEIEPQNVLEIDAIPGPRYVARKERHLVRTVAHSAKTGAPVVEPPTPADAGFDSRREADFGSGGKSHDGVGVACLDRSVTAPGEGRPWPRSNPT